MTGRERIKRVLRGQVPDRVPVFPNVHFGTAHFGGIKIREFATDGRKNAACLIGAYRACGYDGIQVGCDVAVEGEAIGSRVEYPEDNIPSVKEPFLTEPRIERLRFPDPHKDGRMPVIIESTRIVKREVGDEAYITSSLMGPLNCAAQIRGVQNVLLDYYDRPDFLGELMDFAVSVGIEYGKALIDAGADGLLIGEALCSPNVVSPAFYRTLVIERERKLIRALRDYGADCTILHICGDIGKILGDCATTGTNAIDIDWMMNMGAVIAHNEIERAEITARGNLDPSGILRTGTPEEVYSRSRELVEANRAGGRFILGSGCNIQPGPIPEKVIAMVKAAEEHGRTFA